MSFDFSPSRFRSPVGRRSRLSRRMFSGWVLGALLLGGLSAGSGLQAQDVASPAPSTARDSEEREPKRLPPALAWYKGRQIAPAMSYQGAAWLIREEREREEAGQQLLKILKIEPGHVVCDMGCGNGYYALQLAQLVGAQGKVLAVDIQPQMLSLLKQRARKAKVQNVEPILGSLIDPHLPDGEVDMILAVDVYHEFSHPEHMLRAMRKSLKDGGRLVLVEFRAEDPDVPIRPEHKMSKEQIMKELPANGYKLVDQYDKLPWQHVMFFERDDTWEPPSHPADAGPDATPLKRR